MKRIIAIAFFIGITATSFANGTQSLDTIYANEQMNTALFFPKDIRQGIVGNSNFIFTYNREKGQTLGLLKAKKGEDSNLLVITTDGGIYSYIVSYSENLEVLNHFVSVKERIGTEPQTIKNKNTVNQFDKQQDLNRQEKSKTAKSNPKDSSLAQDCDKLLQLPERKKIVKRKHRLTLGIKNIVYKEDLVYLQLEVKNTSGIDFEIGSLEVFKISGNKKKRASYQEINMKPSYVHDMPKIVKHSTKNSFIYVLPKFTFSDYEKIKLKLIETNGSRVLEFSRSIR